MKTTYYIAFCGCATSPLLNSLITLRNIILLHLPIPIKLLLNIQLCGFLVCKCAEIHLLIQMRRTEPLDKVMHIS